MARWRLTNPHYLNVPGTEWEYTETDRTSGRRNRQVFTVPLLLDPNQPADCNYPGEIIVCALDKGQPNDITFIGDPTPEMEPLDEEATAITEACRHRWENPIESLPANGGMTPAEMSFMEKMMDAFGAGNKSVSQSEFDGLKAKLDELTKQNAQLLAAMKSQDETAKPASTSIRR